MEKNVAALLREDAKTIRVTFYMSGATGSFNYSALAGKVHLQLKKY